MDEPRTTVPEREPVAQVDPSEYTDSIQFLGVLRGELCLLATARIPSLKSSPEFVIEDMHPHLQ